MQSPKQPGGWPALIKHAACRSILLGDPIGAAELLEKELWSGDHPCPHCAEKSSKILMGGAVGRVRRAWVCGSCKKQFTVRHGTWLYKGRVALDRVVFAIGVVENEGAAKAIERLVKEARMQPATADKLVAELEERVFGAEPEALPVMPPAVEPVEEPAPSVGRSPALKHRHLWTGALAALLLACLAVWSWEPPTVDAGTKGIEVVELEDKLVSYVLFEMNGIEIQQAISTSRDGFDSTEEWAKAHAKRVAVHQAQANKQ